MPGAPSLQHYAVFGHPIAHSLSPVIHQGFAQQFGIALDYRRIDAPPARFAESVREFLAHGHGANVTLPHKAAAFALADEHSDAARRAGSANVLTRLADGRLAAHNTDGSGLVRDLIERQHVDLCGRNVLLLGAGGAARVQVARATAWACCWKRPPTALRCGTDSGRRLRRCMPNCARAPPAIDLPSGASALGGVTRGPCAREPLPFSHPDVRLCSRRPHTGRC